MFGYNPAKLVFLDESGVNTDMTRRYARAVGGNRSVDSAPLNKPKNTTILSSVRLNGETAYTIYQGGTMEPDSVVGMDNMRSHHTKAVKSLLEQAQVHYAYLPPYSPDLNPIEKMWSKLKAFLRKKKVRLAQDLPGAVRQAFDTITPQDCAGWFRSCGYSG